MKISAFIATSLDGFIARPNGDIDWLTGAATPDSAEDYGYKAFFDGIDTLVVGRKTFDTVLGFPEWPYGGKRVLVLSRGAPALPGNAAPLRGTPEDWRRTLADAGAQHVYVDGGQTIQAFMQAGMLDEIIITRLPLLIGGGIPLFGAQMQDIALDHVATRSYPSGFVQSHYRMRI